VNSYKFLLFVRRKQLKEFFIDWLFIDIIFGFFLNFSNKQSRILKTFDVNSTNINDHLNLIIWKNNYFNKFDLFNEQYCIYLIFLLFYVN